MTTFGEIVDFGIKNGFTEDKKRGYNFLTLLKKNGVKVELSFPDDSLPSVLEEGVNINWEFRVIDEKTDKELFTDWIDIYGETAEEKILDLKNQVLEFINKIATLEIRIEEEFVFSIFGIKFLKYKVLQFETNEGWRE